jgi:hypothetical protein
MPSRQTKPGRKTGLSARPSGGMAAFALSLLLLTAPAHADNAGNPMTFSWGSVHGGTPAIFADGDFTEDTPAAFRAFLRRSNFTPDTGIYLNSLGGDLKAGMDVGRMIREAHLDTGVARNQRDEDVSGAIDPHAHTGIYPGYCVSACALAFLGGVSRKVEVGATYAVHQVSLNCVDRREARARFPWLLVPTVSYCPELHDALALVQEASGAVVEYVRSMGADPIFLTEMSKAGPNAINALTEEQLNAYRINYVVRNESWTFETDSQGAFFLRYLLGDEWKEDRVDLRCDRSDDPRLFLTLTHDTRRSTRREDAAAIIDRTSAGLAVTWQISGSKPDGLAEVRSALLEPYEVIESPRETEDGNVAFTLDVSQRFIDVIGTAEKLQISAVDAEQPGVSGLTLITMALDRDKVSAMVRSCR